MSKISKCAGLALLVGLSANGHAQQNTPNDPEIAAIVLTANQVDVDAGKLAVTHAHAKDVRQFARLMIEDHTSVNDAAVELAHKLNLKPEENATSRSLQQGGKDNLASLNALKGQAFDQAYVDHEVAYHQAVLDAVDKTLIPNAHNPELKALLLKARPTFAAHLEHARHIQHELGKSDD
jgi:putative membrane protein